MRSKFIGGVLLVVGTSLGAGMLALPIANAQFGFWISLGFLVLCWCVMTISALLFLEVNLWLPKNSNFISMAGATLGLGGQIVAWVFYLLLLYSILASYIVGGGDLLHYLASNTQLPIPLWLSSVLFTGMLGTIVFLGIQYVDYANRFLMFGKLGAFLFLVLFIFPFVSMEKINAGLFKWPAVPTSLSVTAVSFACLLIIPSLRTYLDEDLPTLRRVIFLGTVIPLICYILWNFAIMGLIPLTGTHGLLPMLHSETSNSDLIRAITTFTQYGIITVLANFFITICMATSFLSVSLSLSDFLADGLQITKRGWGNLMVISLTFLPSLIIVLFFPDVFMRGLEYAGLCIFVLMILLPPLMAWRGRYHCDLAEAQHYRVRGGKFLLILIVIFALLTIGFGFHNEF